MKPKEGKMPHRAQNPFTLETVGLLDPFCDREEELKAFKEYARDHLKVVVFSPRRYGKTSLIVRVQDDLSKEGVVCPYADFLTVASPGGVAEELMKGVFRALHKRESFIEKGKRFFKSFKSLRPVVMLDETGSKLGIERQSGASEMALLRGALEELKKFVHTHENLKFCFAFDEFQEITRLKETAEIEGLFRSAVQGLRASCFFIGSRRSVLLSLFSDSKKRLYKLARNEEVCPLPSDDIYDYVKERFEQAGKKINKDALKELVRLSDGYAYYMQYLAQELFYLTGDEANLEDVGKAAAGVMNKERHGFAGIIQGLTRQQLRLLKALAEKPVKQITGSEFLGRAGLAPSTVSKSLEYLISQDLVEKREADFFCRVVDPFFRMWLAGEGF